MKPPRHGSVARVLLVMCAAAGWLILLAVAASADTCSIKERDPAHCENTAWVPGVLVAGGGTATTITVIRKIPGRGGSTTTLITTKDGKKVWQRPKFKPPRKTAKGTLDPWDPPIDRQRQKWNEDGEVWDPDTRSWRPPRPDELEELPPWEPPINKSMPRDQVPETCRGLYDAYAAKQEDQHWLDITRKDLEQRLERAIRLFFNNQVKAGIQVSVDITAAGTAIGSGVASGVRAGARGAGGAAGGAARALGAGAELDDLIKRRTSLLQGLDDTPEVQNAKQLREYWGNKTKTAEVDLPKADAARTRYADLESVKKDLGQQMSQAAEYRRPFESTRIRGGADIEGLTEAMHHKLRGLDDVPGPQRELAAIEARIKRLEGTQGGPGRARSKMDQGRFEDLQRLQEQAEGLHQQIRDITSEYQGRIKKVQDQIGDATQKLAEHDKSGYKDLVKRSNKASKASQNALKELHQLEDVTAADLAKYTNLANQAAREVGEARRAARVKIQPELDAIEGQMQDIKKKLAKLNEPEAPSLPVQVVQTLLGPLISAWDKAFGSGNTPKEMIEILLKNKEAVLSAEQDLIRLKAQQELLSNALKQAKQALDACIAANKASGQPAVGPQ